jgi:hypothetical protein
MFQKLKKNEYFCIFLSLPIFIFTKRFFLDPGEFFPETSFTTLVKTTPAPDPKLQCDPSNSKVQIPSVSSTVSISNFPS